MTSVIGGRDGGPYPFAMQPSPHAALAALLEAQRALEVEIQALPADPSGTLVAGEALLQFARQEEEALGALATLLDPVVQTALVREHEEFAEDLELLRWLLDRTPDSPDVAVLSLSLVRRMREHIERDGRLLARAVHLQ